MYTDRNFRTKRELSNAVAQGERVTVYQPGPFGGNEPREGDVAVEGPHYPEPHRWYATATLADGVIIKVDGKVPKYSETKPRAPKKRRPGSGRIAFGCEDIAHWCTGCPPECFL